MIIIYFLLPIFIYSIIKLIIYFINKFKLKQYFNQTPVLLENKEYSKLLYKSLKLIKKYPNNPAINYYLGLSYINLSDPENAIIYLNNSIKNKPDFADAYYALGYLFFHLLANNKDAITNLTKAIELNPDNSNYYNTLSIVFESDKNIKEAENNINKALKLNPNDLSIINNKGIIELKKGEIFDAVNTFKKAYQLKNDDIDVLSNLGNAYSLIQDYDNSIKYFEKLNEINKNTYTLYWLGSTEFLINKNELAKKHLLESISLDNNNAMSYYILSLIMQKESDMGKAKEYWETANKIDPDIKNKINI